MHTSASKLTLNLSNPKWYYFENLADWQQKEKQDAYIFTFFLPLEIPFKPNYNFKSTEYTWVSV